MLIQTVILYYYTIISYSVLTILHTYCTVRSSYRTVRTGGESFVKYGMCPLDKSFPNEDEEVKKLAYAKLRSFDRNTHGQFFWNFRTEFEPRWDFAQAVKKGWLPTDYTHKDTLDMIDNSCNYESVAPVPTHKDVLTKMAGFVLFLFLLVFFIRGCVIVMKKRLNRRHFNYVTIADPQNQSILRTMTTQQHVPSQAHKGLYQQNVKKEIAMI